MARTTERDHIKMVLRKITPVMINTSALPTALARQGCWARKPALADSHINSMSSHLDMGRGPIIIDMDYQDALSSIRQLCGNLNIIVTGPQRSGTTLVAHALAHDLGWDYIDEDDIGWLGANENDSHSLALILNRRNCVIQAPACAHICHTLPCSTAVVFVRREVGDIIASQERMNWQYENMELQKYPEHYQGQTIAAVKYAFWDKIQKPIIKWAYNIEYESLKGHELWVEERQGFGVRQWSV